MAETGDDSIWGQTKLFGLWAKDQVTGGHEAATAWAGANSTGEHPEYTAALAAESSHAEDVTREELKTEITDIGEKILSLPRKALESALGIPFPILLVGAVCLVLGAIFVYRKAGST